MRAERMMRERKRKEKLKKKKNERMERANKCKDEAWINQRRPADGEIKAKNKDAVTKMQKGKKGFSKKTRDEITEKTERVKMRNRSTVRHYLILATSYPSSISIVGGKMMKNKQR